MDPTIIIYYIESLHLSHQHPVFEITTRKQMRPSPLIATSVAVSSFAAFFLHTSCAFTAPRAALSIASTRPRSTLVATTSSYARHPGNNNDADADDDDELLEFIPSLQFIHNNKPASLQPIDDSTTSTKLRQRIQSKLIHVWERTNTLKVAGLYDDDNEKKLQPLQAGFKTNVMLLVGAFLFKWYRARFINKIPVWDRQPQWNMVVTSPEQEKELHAYRCKQCGSTIFIARHREWFFKGGNTECTNCGAKGTENFEDVRGEVLDSIDDDYFDYESPLDFVSAAERRRLVQQAGGDEELAKKIAIENVMKNDAEQIQVDGSSKKKEGGGEKKKKKKKSDDSAAAAPSTKESVPKKKKKDEDDIFDELDMDL
jgi:DNA-directed RNA polymerase subunit RPC12/RpoP